MLRERALLNQFPPPLPISVVFCQKEFILLFFLIFFFTFIHFWETERDRAQAGEGQRERDTHRIQSRLQAPSCQHRARCGIQTHKPQDHDLSRSLTPNRLSHPGALEFILLLSYNRRSWFVDSPQAFLHIYHLKFLEPLNHKLLFTKELVKRLIGVGTLSNWVIQNTNLSLH